MPERRPTELQQIPNFARDFLESGCFFAIDSSRVLIGWGDWKRSESAPDVSSGESCSLLTPDFYLTEQKPWRSPSEFAVVTREFFTTDVLSKLTTEVNSQIPERVDKNERFQWVEPAKEGFEQQVQKIQVHITRGALEKAVPVVHAQAREIMTQDRLLQVIARLNEAPSSLIPSGFWSRTDGLVGATPERLFAIHVEGDSGGRLTTMALAGTRAKHSPADAEALFNDPKERHEHQLVIDDLRKALARFGTVEVGETVTTELPTLFHLKTPIVVHGVRASFDELTKALHPTPALGVSPRSFDFQNMREWDDVKLRGRYGAPFGLFLRTRELSIQDCLVAIRNVQWVNSGAPTLGSGCGFVKESEVDREWSELRLKRDSVKKVLNV